MKFTLEQKLISLKNRLFARSNLQKNGCITWMGPVNERGYGFIRLDRKKCLLTHRASWIIHTGKQPHQLILHTCDVRNCVNFQHLYEGTAQDNSNDKMRRGRYVSGKKLRGSENGNSRITEAVAIEIKQLLTSGNKCSDISRKLEIPFTTVYDIKRKQTWRHI